MRVPPTFGSIRYTISRKKGAAKWIEEKRLCLCVCVFVCLCVCVFVFVCLCVCEFVSYVLCI